MAKVYFNTNYDDSGYSIEYWKQYMEDNFIQELTLVEGKIMTGSGYFFCKEYGEVGEVGQGCGKICEAYKPRNGKNGRCKHSGYCYEETDKKITLKSSGEVKEM